MARYLVHNALTSFTGQAYNGPVMEQAGYEPDSIADFPTIEQAVECAEKLHTEVPSGWLVVHSFNERVLYDSRAHRRVG